MPTFDGENLIITLDSESNISWVDDVYSPWKDWMLSSPLNRRYPEAFRSSGGDPLNTLLNQGAYIFLQNQYGWRIKPPEEDITIWAVGNLAAEDSSIASFLPTTGGYTTQVLGLQPITQGFSTALADGLAYGLFGDAVTVDAVNGVSGTGVTALGAPIGTPKDPVSNLSDAITIAVRLGLKKLRFASDYTFPNGTYITGYELWGTGRHSTIFTFESGCILAFCEVFDAEVTGYETGIVGFNNCAIKDLGSVGLAPSSVEVIAANCTFEGTLTLPSNYSGTIVAVNCAALPDDSGNPPVIDHGNSTASVQTRNWSGLVSIKNVTEAVDVRMFFTSGGITLDSTVTAGNFLFSGVGIKAYNQASVTSLNDQGLICRTVIAEAVQEYVIEGSLTMEEVMRIILSAVAGDSAGAGTSVFSYKSVDGGTSRIQATFDVDGNRQITLLSALIGTRDLMSLRMSLLRSIR